MKVEAALLILVAVGVVPIGVSAQSVGASGGALAVSWPDSDWNPHKDNDDVKVSLPCGGAMAFRPVTTSESRNPRDLDLLDDRRVVLGDAEREENPVATYIRTDYLAGTFRRRDGVQYYLIGKYEVTDRQYAAVMAEAGQCPPPGEGPALPKTDVGWYDAVDFTRRLNRWLYANSSATKPWTDMQFGFVRLPTDAEWEFAARGGLAVSDAERARPTPVPIGGLLDEYAWFAGGVASAGAKHKIGMLKPNPLLLYDMLGNVEEIVADPFRMVWTGRMHGKAGAVTYRGGSYRTPGESLRSSNRTEMRLYGEAGREVKFPFVGFRLAVGATATPDLGSAVEARKAWERSMQIGNTVGGEAIVAKLEGVMFETSGPGRQVIRDALATMNELNDSLKKKASEAVDLENVADRQSTAAVQALLEHALTFKAVITSSAHQLDDWQKHAEDAASSRQQREMAAVSLEGEKQRFVSLVEAYTRILGNLKEYPAEKVDRLIASSSQIEEQYGDKARAVDLASIGNFLKKYRQQAGRMSIKDISRALVGDHKWIPR